MATDAQLEPSVLTSAAGEDSMSSGSLDVTSSGGDSSSDEGPPLPPPARYEVGDPPTHGMHACMRAKDTFKLPPSVHATQLTLPLLHDKHQIESASQGHLALRVEVPDTRSAFACSQHSGTRQQTQSHLLPLGLVMVGAEQAAARAPAHQAGSLWITFSAFFPVAGSRKLLQYERLQVSLLLALPQMSTQALLGLDSVWSFPEGQTYDGCRSMEGMRERSCLCENIPQ